MIKILSKLALLTVGSWFNSIPYDVFQIPEEHFQSQFIKEELSDFEQAFTYPFSTTEHFHIRHGKQGNYFEFFQQLGKPYYYITICTKNSSAKKTTSSGNTVEIKHHRGEIAAAGCGILRSVPTHKGQTTAWYICDLKVKENYQGEHLPLFMLQQVALGHLMQCRKGYGICMNPKVGEPKAAAIFKKHGPFGMLQTQTLNLYTLSAATATTSYNEIQSILRNLGYLRSTEKIVFRSTNGSKDYVITNDTTDEKSSWKLFHLQRTSDLTATLFENNRLEVDGTYMCCAIEGTSLDSEFKKICGIATSTAQVVSYGMEDVDFNFLTSNQI